MGDCALSGYRASEAQTPDFVDRGMKCAVLTALPAYSRCCAARTAFRFVTDGADHRSILRVRSLVSRNAPEELSRFVRTPARRKFVGPLLSLSGNSGEASRRPIWLVPPRWRSPPLNRRGAWEGEKGVPLLLGAVRLCCAEAGG